MARLTFLGVGLLSSIVGALTQNASEEITVHGRYEGQEGAKLIGLGVCKLTPDSIDCWGMDAKRTTSLNEEVRRSLSADPPANVPFRPGRQSRYLVVSELMNGNPFITYGGQGHSHVRLGRNAEPFLTLIPVDYENGRGEASFELWIDDLAKSPTGTLAFHDGASVSVGDIEFEMGPSREEFNRIPMSPRLLMLPGSRAWSAIVGSRSKNPVPTLHFEVLGSDGKPIRFVDNSGEPVSDAVFKKWLDSQRNKGWSGLEGLRYVQALCESGSPAIPGATTVYTNVNPKHIGSLRITAAIRRHITVTGFPLDPE